MLSEGRNLVLSGFWWATTFAGLMILLTVLSLNILSEGLTDALVNPKLKRNQRTIKVMYQNLFLLMYKKLWQKV